MDIRNLDNVECVWKPIRPFVKSKFMQLLEDKYHAKINNYWDFHKWSIENHSAFWAEVWDLVQLKYSKKYDQIIESLPMSNIPKWFVGARLNLVENLLLRRDNHVALIAIGEDRDKSIITYSDAYEEVKLYAAAFRKHGLKKGNKVACYMSNREEAVYTMLAIVSIGAIWIGILPLIGAQAALDRLNQVNPHVILSVDRIRNNGVEIDMLPKLEEIVKGLPSLEKVIIVPSKTDSTKKDINGIPKSCFLEDFLSLGRDSDGSVPDIVYEQVSFSDPVFISYTSGTTGKPKALVHGTGVS